MKKHFRHVRHQAKAHHKAHRDLDELLKKDLFTEGVLGIFLSTLIITTSVLLILFNWHRLSDILSTDGVINRVEVAEEKPIKEAVIEPFNATQGAISGAVAVYETSRISEETYVDKLLNTPSETYEKGATESIKPPKSKPQLYSSFNSATFLTNHLSEGGYVNSLRSGNIFQRSILSTFYLGEKTTSVNSSLQADSRILSQINSALSVDVFAYLNQSVNRANSLDSYLNLLKTLQETAEKTLK